MDGIVRRIRFWSPSIPTTRVDRGSRFAVYLQNCLTNQQKRDPLQEIVILVYNFLLVLFCLSLSAGLSLLVPLYLSCSACPVLPVALFLSCSVCPALPVLFWMFCSASHSGCHVLAVPFWLPILAVLFRLSFSGCPSWLFFPSYHGCPVLAVQLWLPCPGHKVLAVLSRWSGDSALALSCSGCLVLTVLFGFSCPAATFCLFRFGCPILAVMFMVSFTGCSLSAVLS